MTYKSNEKSFFEKEIVEPIQEKKEDLELLEQKGAKKVLKWYDFGASSLRDEIKKRPAQYFFLFITSFIGSALTTGAALIIFSGNIIAQFTVPKAPVVNGTAQVRQEVVQIQKYDPLLLADKLKKKESDFELVDIRGVSDFVGGHIVGAVNLPIYGTSIVNKDGEVDPKAVRETFKGYLGTEKTLIIYAQNAYSTIPSDIASILTSSKKKVRALAVGWDEWTRLVK